MKKLATKAPDGSVWDEGRLSALGATIWFKDDGIYVEPDNLDLSSYASVRAGGSVPQEISRRQFFQQLAVDQDITQDEALAAVTAGTLPKKLADAVATLPSDQQFEAKMLICGATSFLRSHPMVAILGAALNKNDDALDDLWIAASKL